MEETSARVVLRYGRERITTVVDRDLCLDQIAKAVGATSTAHLTVIYKGEKLSEGFRLPACKATLLVLSSSAADVAALDDPSEECPRVVRDWLPRPVADAANFGLGAARWLAGQAVAASALLRPAVEDGDTVQCHAPGTEARLTVEFDVEGTEGEASARVLWSIDGCGELQGPREEVVAGGGPKVCSQVVLCNGFAGHATCRIQDLRDGKESSKMFWFREHANAL